MTKTKHTNCDDQIEELFFEKDEQGMFYDVEIIHCDSDESCKHEEIGLCKCKENK
jgi:hypothetical protein